MTKRKCGGLRNRCESRAELRERWRGQAADTGTVLSEVLGGRIQQEKHEVEQDVFPWKKKKKKGAMPCLVSSLGSASLINHLAPLCPGPASWNLTSSVFATRYYTAARSWSNRFHCNSAQHSQTQPLNKQSRVDGILGDIRHGETRRRKTDWQNLMDFICPKGKQWLLNSILIGQYSCVRTLCTFTITGKHVGSWYNRLI